MRQIACKDKEGALALAKSSPERDIGLK